MNPSDPDPSFSSKSQQFAQDIFSTIKNLGAKISKFYAENCSSYVKTAQEKAKANTWVIVPCVVLGVALFFEYRGSKKNKAKKSGTQESKKEQPSNMKPPQPDNNQKLSHHPFEGEEEEKKEEEIKADHQEIQFTDEQVGDMPKKRKKKSKKSFIDNYYSEESRRERVLRRKDVTKDPQGAGNYATEDGSDVHDGYSTTLSERDSIKPRRHSRAPQKIAVLESGYKSDNDKPKKNPNDTNTELITRNLTQVQSPADTRDTVFLQVLQNIASVKN